VCTISLKRKGLEALGLRNISTSTPVEQGVTIRAMRTKAELREELRTKRTNMSKDEAKAKSRAITLRFLQSIDWLKIKSVNIYNSNEAWNEVDTKMIKAAIHLQWPKIQLTSMPVSKTSLPPLGKFDLIVVPTLGFDDKCFRLGLGGGFYDRFLASQPQAQKVGLAYELLKLALFCQAN
jgi:5-formyltetrahydrofolate cyclo-ligase